MGGKKNYKVFISEDEEVRSGFLVSSNRKKVWNVQLGLLEEVKRICKKYGIKYYADSGTLLGSIRHGGFIPWDDDMDIAMFREDYEKFREAALKELPDHILLCKYHGGFSKLINKNTAALGYENWWDKDFVGGIGIDIFPIDYASRFEIINRIKYQILRFLRVIMSSQKSDGAIKKLSKQKKIFAYPIKFFFSKANCSKVYKIHENISKNVLFKGKSIYISWKPNIYFPANIYKSSHNIKFEETTICVPDGYDEWLKICYGDYMKPIIYEGGHNLYYSIDKSYKDIIKTFDKSKSNEENYNNCKDLFLL